MVQGVAAVAAAEGVDLGHEDLVLALRLGEDLALGGNDHGARAPLGDHDVDEVLDRARADGRPADLAVDDGRPPERRVEDEVGPAEGEAPGGFREDHVVADQEAHRPDVRGREDGEAVSPLLGQLVDGHVDLVVVADLLPVAAEEEGGIADGAVRIDRVVAADQVHGVVGGRGPQSLEHAPLRLGEDAGQERLVRGLPGPESQGVLR